MELVGEELVEHWRTQAASTQLKNHQGRTQAVRVDLFPKLGLFCRLPSPTLFYRPEASNLRDLKRIMATTRRCEEVCRESTGHHRKTRCLVRNVALSPENLIPSVAAWLKNLAQAFGSSWKGTSFCLRVRERPAREERAALQKGLELKTNSVSLSTIIFLAPWLRKVAVVYSCTLLFLAHLLIPRSPHRETCREPGIPPRPNPLPVDVNLRVLAFVVLVPVSMSTTASMAVAIEGGRGTRVMGSQGAEQPTVPWGGWHV